MPDEDKNTAINDLKNDIFDILIATIALEVGVSIPKLRRVVVVSPNRFGLSTLHQIRGRVARAGGVGYCDLLVDAPIGEDADRKLQALVEHSDGLTIANKAMEI